MRLHIKVLVYLLCFLNHILNPDDLETLVPQMCLQGLMGYPFACPDMIGGGEYLCFLDGAAVDQELVVRSAQAHALMPMMQFSVAPWRVLDERHLAAVLNAVEIRQLFRDVILDEVRRSACSGEPVMRLMEYEFPHRGYSEVKDQFFIGRDLLVAPVLRASIDCRKVLVPEGRWEDHQGKILEGPVCINESVELNTLLYYRRLH